jgi:purine-binding chemotaxis protein CheW
MSAHPRAELAALAASAGHAPRQYLNFVLGENTYAIDILRIKEIIEYDKLTSVPMMPASVRGVINLRGAVVPVIDLAVSFDRPATRAGRRTCIVIIETAVEGGTQEIGVLVDAVNEVMDMNAADLEPPPAFGARIPSRCIAAMGRNAQGFIIVLDVDYLVGHLPRESTPAAEAARAAGDRAGGTQAGSDEAGSGMAPHQEQAATEMAH